MDSPYKKLIDEYKAVIARAKELKNEIDRLNSMIPISSGHSNYQEVIKKRRNG